MQMPGLTCENEDIRVFGRRTYTTLPVATVESMDIIASVIDLTWYEG
jgi:hypothetical protein